jgi:hypothetical protein
VSWWRKFACGGLNFAFPALLTQEIPLICPKGDYSYRTGGIIQLFHTNVLNVCLKRLFDKNAQALFAIFKKK